MIRGVLVNFRTRTLTRGDRRLRLGKIAFRVVAALLAATNGILKPALIDYAWGDDPDGGPLNAASVLHIVCQRYARPLEHIGLTLTRGRYNTPFIVADRWTPAEHVAHLQAAADAAAQLASRSHGSAAYFAGAVASELQRISA